MEELVSCICTKCGAALNVESSHKEFDCPFCGNGFDFADIHYRELLSDAKSYLRRMRFVMAKNKFDEILESRPQDFEALQGLVLCALGLQSENSLNEMDELKGCNLEAARSVLANVEGRASEKDAPYFAKLAEMIDIVIKYNTLCTEQAGLSEQIHSLRKKLIEATDRLNSAIKVALPLAGVAFVGLYYLIDPFNNLRGYPEDLTILDFILWIIPIAIVVPLSIYRVVRAYMNLHKIKACPIQTSRLEEYDEKKAQAIKDFYQAIIFLNSYRPSMNESDIVTFPAFAPEKTTNFVPSFRNGMRKLSGYICIKCGAALNIGTSDEVFDCPFCGNAFDYADVHYRELLSDAKSALRNMEFVAAKNKFDEILESRPQDFEALQGLVLCALKFRTENSLKDIEAFKNCNLEAARSTVVNVVGRASEKNVPYFDRIIKLIDLAKESKDIDSQQTELSDQRQRFMGPTSSRTKKSDHKTDYPDEFSEQKYTDRSNEDLKANDKEKSKKASVLVKLYVALFYGLIIAVVVLWYIVGIYGSIIRLDFLPNNRIMRIVTLIAFAISLVVVPIVLLIKKKKDKESEEYGKALLSKSVAIDKKQRKLTAEIKTEIAALDEFEPVKDEVENYAPPVFTPNAITVAGSSLGTDKKLTCYMCAGELVFETNRKIYRCDHCGVAYGSSLFTGNPLENALDAMENGEFYEADLHCQIELGIHPQNCQAHRLRILCVLKKLSFVNLETVNDLSYMILQRMGERADEAIQNVPEPDREYFRLFPTFINSYYKKYYTFSKADDHNDSTEETGYHFNLYDDPDQSVYDRNQMLKRSERKNSGNTSRDNNAVLQKEIRSSVLRIQGLERKNDYVYKHTEEKAPDVQ